MYDGVWTPISDNPSHVIVSKDGMYGVILLTDSVPKPSSWAQTEVAEAVQKGLVPDDVKVWWKDSCTRLEFCRMLARTAAILKIQATGTKIVFADESQFPVLLSQRLRLFRRFLPVPEEPRSCREAETISFRPDAIPRWNNLPLHCIG